MHITLEDMVQYCLLVRKSYDLIGKTFLGRPILKKAGVRVPPRELNPNNPSSLTYDLWNFKRNGYEVAPIDDADRLMRSDPRIGVMKHGWNADDPQINCFGTERIRKNEEYRNQMSERYDPAIPPPSFEYRLATPWFANKNLSMPGGVAEHTHPDFAALIDRGLRPRWINSDPRNVFFYTVWMVERGGLFTSINLTLAEAEDTLEAFIDAAIRLQHPNPNLRLATDLAKVRKNPNHKTLWKRIVDDSLARTEGEPRAVDENDMKLRPDLRRAVEEARKEAERRKEVAARALAEARAAAEREKAEREARDREAAETARREAEEIASSFETAKAKGPIPKVPEIAPARKLKKQPAALREYTPPPGHVFPPPFTDVKAVEATEKVKAAAADPDADLEASNLAFFKAEAAKKQAEAQTAKQSEPDPEPTPTPPTGGRPKPMAKYATPVQSVQIVKPVRTTPVGGTSCVRGGHQALLTDLIASTKLIFDHVTGGANPNTYDVILTDPPWVREYESERQCREALRPDD